MLRRDESHISISFDDLLSCTLLLLFISFVGVLMSRVLIFGNEGQLASSFKNTKLGQDAVFLGKAQVDFLHPHSILECLESNKPQVIINTAAYTNVDLAESERSKCETINSESVGTLAQWATLNNCHLIHFSTDYVFSGAGRAPWTEESPTGALNLYGETKRLGEQRILTSGCQATIFRTSWVFSEYGHNFVKTMLRLGSERSELKIVSDQMGSPTYAADIANFVDKNLEKILSQKVQGIFNLTNQGFTNWYEFASEIFRLAKRYHWPMKVNKIEPIFSKDYVTPAKRPLNSRLDPTKTEKFFGYTLPSWQDGLKQCIANLGKQNGC